MIEIKGTLIPIGGNEQKEDNEDDGLDFIEEGILSHVLRESGGKSARILIIPTASSIPEVVADNYLTAFEQLGCDHVSVLNIRESSECESEENLKALREANCLMFSGGDQSKITRIIGNTTFHKIMQERFINEDFVIAGTSAGAMAMANEMIAGGSSTEAMLKGAVKMYKGLSLIPDLVIDTHFIKRGRFGRLVEAVAIHPNLLGIGLAEDTGMIIKNCNEFEIIGSGMVIMVDGSELTHNSHEDLPEGTPISISNLITHVLANGDRFTINDKSVNILPISGEFV